MKRRKGGGDRDKLRGTSLKKRGGRGGAKERSKSAIGARGECVSVCECVSECL